MIKKLSPLSSKNKSRSFWWFGLKLGIVLAIALWWWLQDEFEDGGDTSQDRIELTPDVPDQAPSAGGDEEEPAAPDDLTEIDGIGPKYAQVLNAAGVVSFSQLAGMAPDQIRAVFHDAGKRAPNADTWPKLAAKRSVK